MRMGKRAGIAVFTIAGAALTIGVGASAALAATTLTVKVTHGGTYKATAPAAVLKDNGVSLTCSSRSAAKASTATGSIRTGTHTGPSPVRIGTAATLTFKHCTSGHEPVTITVNHLPYSVKADSKTNKAGQTDVMVTGINASVSMKGCSFTVTGAAPGFYANNTHKLALQPTLPITALNRARLTISSVVGCAGQIMNGDHPAFKASYTANRAIKISSK
jgi:hypothetical protein